MMSNKHLKYKGRTLFYSPSSYAVIPMGYTGKLGNPFFVNNYHMYWHMEYSEVVEDMRKYEWRYVCLGAVKLKPIAATYAISTSRTCLNDVTLDDFLEDLTYE